MAAVHSKCYALLSGASASTYNQAELSMLCRSKLPVEVCRMAAGELGPTPWSPSTMGRACGKWEEQWSERAVQMSPEERRLDGEDWQAQIDEITRKKAAVGICTGKAVDECAAHKREEYPKYTKQLNDAMAEKYRSYRDDRSGLGAAGEGAPAEAEAYVADAGGASTGAVSQPKQVLSSSEGGERDNGLAAVAVAALGVAAVGLLPNAPAEVFRPSACSASARARAARRGAGRWRRTRTPPRTTRRRARSRPRDPGWHPAVSLPPTPVRCSTGWTPITTECCRVRSGPLVKRCCAPMARCRLCRCLELGALGTHSGSP